MSSSGQLKFGQDDTRAIYDVVQSFIGLISTDGVLLDANQSALTFIGADLDDVVGTNFWDCPWWRGCEASRTSLMEAIRRGANGKGSRFEVRLTGHDGQMIPADFSLTPVRNSDGEVIFLAPEARDVTDIKASQETLVETQTRLSLAYDAAGIGTWDLDLEHDELYWSDRQYELFDMPRTEKIDFQTVLAKLHPEDRDRVTRATLAAIRDDRPYRDEFRVVHRNGEVRWLVGQGRPLRHDADGQPQAMTGVNYDITESKSAELRLAHMNEELEARVAKRTRELEREMRERQAAQTALAHSQRLDAIGQLAGGVAHDFNNLLAIIGGNLELIAAKLSDKRLVAMIEDALSAVDAGADLNRRLLSFAQKRPLHAVRFSVNDRVTFAQALLARTLHENIVLQTELDDTVSLTCADSGEFDSALLNLAINARDAMPKGGTLRIATANRVIDPEDATLDPALEVGAFVRVSVSDTGTGMTPDVLQQAMTPFFTTKELGKGSGLGLSSVFGFARQSGGFVTIQSAQGTGTTVSIYLPQAREVVETALDVTLEDEIGTGHGEVVLAVEDNKAVLNLTRKRLKALGYTVIEATDASRAIELLETGRKVSLVFSDIRMPGPLSGYDLAAWVAEHRPEVKVLLTTGYSEFEASDDRSLKVLPKPYSIKALANALRDALG